MTPESILAELEEIAPKREKLDVRERQLLALLRSSIGAVPPASVEVRLPTDWITTSEAAELSGLSAGHIAKLCDKHHLDDDPVHGFARWNSGHWELSRSRFTAHIRQRPARRRP